MSTLDFGFGAAASHVSWCTRRLVPLPLAVCTSRSMLASLHGWSGPSAATPAGQAQVIGNGGDRREKKLSYEQQSTQACTAILGGTARWKLLALLVPLLFALLQASTPAPAQAAPGDLDPSFGTGGKALIDVPSAGTRWTQAMAIQPDGKLVVAGRANDDFLVARLNSDGSLDTSFGGLVMVDFDINDSANAVAIQPDGKIVVAGHTSDTSAGETNGNIAVARLNDDGSLDSSFDGDGKVTVDLGANEGTSGLSIDGDGKIVIAGSHQVTLAPGEASFAVVRLNSDGSLDTSFDSDGSRLIQFAGHDHSFASSVDIQSDGKLVVAGCTEDEFEACEGAMARLNSDGSLDASFSAGGTKTVDIFDTEGIEDIALQPDDKIVAVGDILSGGVFKSAVIRLNSDGSSDGGFGSAGVAEVSGQTNATAVDLQPDGKMIVAGSDHDGLSFNFAIARLTTSGALDTSFAGDGQTTVDFGGDDFARATVLQLDGAIVVAGDSFGEAVEPLMAVARLEGGEGSSEPESPTDPSPDEGSTPSPSGGSTQPVPLPLAPSPTPKLTPGKARFASAGQIKGKVALIRTRCVGDTRCRGVAKLIARVKTRRVVKRGGKTRVVRRKRNVVIGKSRFNLAPGRKGVLQVRLTRAGRKLAKRNGRRGLRGRLVGRGLQNRAIKLRPQNRKRNKGKKRSGRGGKPAAH